MRKQKFPLHYMGAVPCWVFFLNSGQHDKIYFCTLILINMFFFAAHKDDNRLLECLTQDSGKEKHIT